MPGGDAAVAQMQRATGCRMPDDQLFDPATDVQIARRHGHFVFHRAEVVGLQCPLDDVVRMARFVGSKQPRNACDESPWRCPEYGPLTGQLRAAIDVDGVRFISLIPQVMRLAAEYVIGAEMDHARPSCLTAFGQKLRCHRIGQKGALRLHFTNVRAGHACGIEQHLKGLCRQLCGEGVRLLKIQVRTPPSRGFIPSGQMAVQGTTQTTGGAENEDAGNWHGACLARLPHLQSQKACPR